jgi:hypothetical protein
MNARQSVQPSPVIHECQTISPAQSFNWVPNKQGDIAVNAQSVSGHGLCGRSFPARRR